MRGFLLGFLLAVVLVPVCLMGWLYFGKLPVAVADPPFPQERLITGVPLHARIDREMVKAPPIPSDEEVFIAGAYVYSERCAVCHGMHGKPSAIGAHMFPDAPPLWEKHGNGEVVGVSDDPPGETYWKVANGIRLTGMPAYTGVLTETEMWEVSLLLANADKPMPPQALAILRGDEGAAQAGQAPAAKAESKATKGK